MNSGAMSVKQGVVIQRPSDLTVAWAQRVAERNTPDSVVVSAVEILSVDVGTTTRVRIAVDHNGPNTLPGRWFVKFPSLSWRARLITALPRLLQREVRFYKEVVQSVPVARPAMLAAGSTLGRGPTLVLADVTELGGIPGFPSDSLTSAQAAKVVEQLAKLHARFWNKSSLEREYSWLGGPIQRSEKRLEKVLSVPLIKRGVRLSGSAIPSTLHAPAICYARQRSKAMQTFAAGPRTLVHHDCHPGNIFWNKSESGLLDWQLVRRGNSVKQTYSADKFFIS